MTDAKLIKMTDAEYNAHPGIRSSTLKKFRSARTPRHFKHEQDNPSESGQEMILGNAFHCAVLEPHLFEERYYVMPKIDRRTKEGKALAAALPTDKISLEMDEWEKVHAMAKEMRDHDYCRWLLQNATEKEVVIEWTDDETGLLCKCKIDFFVQYTDGDGNTKHFLPDLKTTKDARLYQFSGDIFKYGYHMQAAWYTEGYRQLFGVTPDFLFAAPENTAPFAGALISVPAVIVEMGRIENEKTLHAYNQCLQKNEWPGYPVHPVEAVIPKWIGE